MGRIRARCLTARLPNPPVRTVHATFTAHGSRDRDIDGDVHFARIPPYPWWTACAFPGSLCTVSLPSPSGPSPCLGLSHTPTPRPNLTACRASEIAVRLSPASSPLSFTSLAGSPVSVMEHANTRGEGARSRGPVHALGLPSAGIGYAGCSLPPFLQHRSWVLQRSLLPHPAVASLTGSHQREGMRGAAFPVGRGVLQVMHRTISQPNATSWILPFPSWRLLGACCSRHRVVCSA